MKRVYRGFEIEVARDRSLGGDVLTYYSIFRVEDGWELASGHEYGPVRECFDGCKITIDEYHEHPEHFDDTYVILCVFGSRSVKDPATVAVAIEEGLALLGLDVVDELIHGAASGVDSLAAKWAAEDPAITITPYPAAWDDLDAPGAVVRQGPRGPYNVKAGFDRNQTMSERATHFIAVRGKGKSSGTDDMIKRVEATGKPIEVIRV